MVWGRCIIRRNRRQQSGSEYLTQKTQRAQKESPAEEPSLSLTQRFQGVLRQLLQALYPGRGLYFLFLRVGQLLFHSPLRLLTLLILTGKRIYQTAEIL